MAQQRSKKFYFFTALLGVIAALALLITFKTGPVGRSLQTRDGVELETAASMSGVACQEQIFTVKLTADAWFTHDVAGTLCWMGAPDGKTLAVQVSGAGYDSIYWDFPYQPDTYSFTRAALRHGLATFNFDRLGMGRSDRPWGLSLGVDNQAYVLAQIIEALQGEHEFNAVVTLGHSFGSTI